MNKIFNYVFLIFLTALVFVLSCCKDHEEPYAHPEEYKFLIHLDSIIMPSVVKKDSIFEIKYFGIIGTDACYRFDQFFYTTNREPDGTGIIIVEPLGIHDLTTKNCLQTIVYLDGNKNENHKQKFAISQTGLYKYIFKQTIGEPFIVRDLIVKN